METPQDKRWPQEIRGNDCRWMDNSWLAMGRWFEHSDDEKVLMVASGVLSLLLLSMGGLGLLRRGASPIVAGVLLAGVAAVLMWRWLLRDIRLTRRRRELVVKERISPELVRETRGEAYSYRTLLLTRTFNGLVWRIDLYRRACEMGMRAPLEREAEMLESVRAVRERLVRAGKLITLMRETRASEAYLTHQRHLIEALDLTGAAEGVRVVIESEEINPEADGDLSTAITELNRELGGSGRS